MDKIKNEIYENATKNLLHKIDSMNLDVKSRLRAKNFVLLFRDSFKIQNIKYKTFYPTLSKSDINDLGYDSTGFCYVSNASFMLLNKDIPFELYFIDERKWFLGPHFFLKEKNTNLVFDLTYDQFTYNGNTIPYNLGMPESIVWDELIDGFTKAVSPQLNDETKKAYNGYAIKTRTYR